MTSTRAPRPTGAWQSGDPVAFRQFADVGSVMLELGGALPDVRVAFEAVGELNDSGDNAVLVLHALTGDAHASGPTAPGQPTPGWWGDLIGPGKILDPAEYYIVSSNVLGGCQGTTGPASAAPDGRPWGSRWPRITIRDQVEVESRLADHLGVGRFRAVLGGSMGGMRALEWAATHPQRVGAALVVAASAAASADQVGTQTAQILAVTNDPAWNGGDYYHTHQGPSAGMGLARRFAHLTYRTETELDIRFGRDFQERENPLGPCIAGRHEHAGRFAVQSYLDHHADKLARRFDAGTYVCLTDAMNTHDVGRGRGGVAAALQAIEVPIVVAGIDSDRLYPLRQQQELAEHLPQVDGLEVIASPYGHDGFLLEPAAVAPLVARTLELGIRSDRQVAAG